MKRFKDNSNRKPKTGDDKYAKGKKSLNGHSVETDGVDHINIHSWAKTILGQKLSHFAHTPFTHPYFGPFYSMEGFWYFARSGFGDSRLRYLSGLRAKRVGKTLPCTRYAEFKDDILAANYQKIIQNDDIRQLMVESTLPFDHYYTFEDTDIHVTPKEAEWLIQGFEDIRTALKEGVVPSLWTDAEKRYLENAKK